MSELSSVLSAVSRRVDPTDVDVARFREIADKLLGHVRNACTGLGLEVPVRLVGSAAKDTWVKGSEEIDVFVFFNPDVERDELEKSIIEIGSRAIKSAGGKPSLRYAEHPFVEGSISGIRTNVVACYNVPKGEWISAADRTPHHASYVNSKMDSDARSHTRLLKRFLIGCGLYGAEIRVGGFSGYLSELLTIHYGDFPKTIEAASSWKPPVFIDVENLLKNKRQAIEAFPGSPLVVIDPVDPDRNVAAAVTSTRFSEFILASKILLDRPRVSLFFPTKPKGKTANQLLGAIKEGKRRLLAIAFENGKSTSPDVLWGELNKSLSGIRRALVLEGFSVIRSEAFSGDEINVLLYELESAKRPETYKHLGPPVHVDDAEAFIEKHHEATETTSGPWVEGHRLYVAKRRKRTGAGAVIRERMKAQRVSLSKRLQRAILNGRILTGNGIVKLCEQDTKFCAFLNEFLEGRPTFLRRR